ncbi:MAG: T9SS type A sorting domain-containing protein, partial [Bacteroidota bacterium]
VEVAEPVAALGEVDRDVVRLHAEVATDVTLTVYDLLGRRVATLVDAPQTPGRYAVSFDAAGLASGAYVVRLQAGDGVSVIRLTVAR